MTNPLFFQYAFVTSSRQSKNAMHAFKNDTQVYYSKHVGILLQYLQDAKQLTTFAFSQKLLRLKQFAKMQTHTDLYILMQTNAEFSAHQAGKLFFSLQHIMPSSLNLMLCLSVCFVLQCLLALPAQEGGNKGNKNYLQRLKPNSRMFATNGTKI